VRYLVLSDLHANMEAFRAVLTDAKRFGYDQVVCLGDIVGYGADPNEVVDLLRAQNPRAVVRGNHDKVATGLEEGEEFSEIALAAALWTRETLSEENRRYLAELPRGPMAVDGFLISHGTPLMEDAYLLSDYDAECIFEAMDFSLAFFGHSHYACAFYSLDGEEIELRMLEGEDRTLPIEAAGRYLVNPGSIGQPRDHDPRAAYALYDDEAGRARVNRVASDITSTQNRMIAKGLPEPLAQRLEHGI
jgi:predicted phosphodiesterase